LNSLMYNIIVCGCNQCLQKTWLADFGEGRFELLQ
jgi:hypothetical protein